jgi:hypothetical protein
MQREPSPGNAHSRHTMLLCFQALVWKQAINTPIHSHLLLWLHIFWQLGSNAFVVNVVLHFFLKEVFLWAGPERRKFASLFIPTNGGVRFRK